MECTNFADYYQYFFHIKKEPAKCPACGKDMKTQFYATFDLIKLGKAEHTCTNPKCHFHRDKIVVEAVGDKTIGGVFR